MKTTLEKTVADQAAEINEKLEKQGESLTDTQEAISVTNKTIEEKA